MEEEEAPVPDPVPGAASAEYINSLFMADGQRLTYNKGAPVARWNMDANTSKLLLAEFSQHMTFHISWDSKDAFMTTISPTAQGTTSNTGTRRKLLATRVAARANPEALAKPGTGRRGAS
jgi:hypothetical protein